MVSLSWTSSISTTMASIAPYQVRTIPSGKEEEDEDKKETRGTKSRGEEVQEEQEIHGVDS